MKNKKRLLITGVSGLLGSNVAYCLKDRYEILGLFHSRPISLKGISTRWSDLRSLTHTETIIREFNPHIVLHAAAQADVDICEENPQAAREANVLATSNIVKALGTGKVKLIHISTDLVYDGINTPCRETDKTGPLNYYGLTKLDAEREALKYPGALVLRTNFFGWGIAARRSLAQWLIEELKAQRPVKGFTDVTFSSLYTFDLAGIIPLLIDKKIKGIYNCGTRNAMSKYDFLRTVAQKAGFSESNIKPVSVDQFPFKAQRAKNLAMDVSRLGRDLGITLPDIEEGISRFIADKDNNFPATMFREIERTSYQPYLNYLPYGRQAIDEEDVKAVEEVLYSSNLTQGPKIEEFEWELTKLTGASFCVAVNSGTSALHIACLAAGVGKKDEVITSTNTFVASANAAVYCGARPVFTDIDPKTFTMSPEDLARKINARTKAIIPVHFAGQSADMRKIREIVAQAEKKYKRKIFVIEDASHALGSLYQNKKVGAGQYSDMTVFSFHPVKHITTGEGGAVLTNDKNLHRELCLTRSHGITTYVDEMTQKKEAFEPSDNDKTDLVKRPWYYEQQKLGYNYRITDLQCALGISQLKKLPAFIKRRRAIFDLYQKNFTGLKNIRIPYENYPGESNFHLYVLLLDFKAMQKSRHQVMTELKKNGIVTQVHYIPVHTQPFYQKTFGTKWEDCPVAEKYYRQCLSIPFFPAMTDEEAAKVIEGVKKVCGV